MGASLPVVSLLAARTSLCLVRSQVASLMWFSGSWPVDSALQAAQRCKHPNICFPLLSIINENHGCERFSCEVTDWLLAAFVCCRLTVRRCSCVGGPSVAVRVPPGLSGAPLPGLDTCWSKWMRGIAPSGCDLYPTRCLLTESF